MFIMLCVIAVIIVIIIIGIIIWWKLKLKKGQTVNNGLIMQRGRFKYDNEKNKVDQDATLRLESIEEDIPPPKISSRMSSMTKEESMRSDYPMMQFR